LLVVGEDVVQNVVVCVEDDDDIFRIGLSLYEMNWIGPSKEPCGTLHESRPQVGLYDTIRYDTIRLN